VITGYYDFEWWLSEGWGGELEWISVHRQSLSDGLPILVWAASGDKSPVQKSPDVIAYYKLLELQMLVKRELIAVLMIFFGAVILDQVSKLHAQRDLVRWQDETNIRQYTGKSIPLGSVGTPRDPGPTNFYIGTALTYSRNTGAAFSMLADLDDRIRVPFFYAVTVIAVIAIFFFYRSTPSEHAFTRYGLVMIMAGAIGNFLDRVRWGYVVDFFDVHWDILGWRHDFAIFNVADVCINIGVIAYLIDAIRLWLKERREKSSANGQDRLAAGAGQ
jgi:signal peptidase II